jgi:hypothetical protein
MSKQKTQNNNKKKKKNTSANMDVKLDVKFSIDEILNDNSINNNLFNDTMKAISNNSKSCSDGSEILKENIKVNRIFCLSDIHIKNGSEHDHKFNHAFLNVFKELKNKKADKNDVVCITGDIMDDGGNAHPNAIFLVKKLYKYLSTFCPVITILGNHDIRSNIDGLTPLVGYCFEKTNYPLYFLLENKVYIYGDLAFGHTKFDSSNVTSCKKFKDKYTTIALFHGIINGSTLDNDCIGRSQFSMKDFKGYEYCIFGDIHKHQFLNKENSAFYTGSLLQCKKNETGKHGMIVLDLNEEEIEYIEISSGHKILGITDKIKDADINDMIDDIKSVDLNFSYEKYDTNKFEQVKEMFEKRGITVSSYTKIPKFNVMNVDTTVKKKGKHVKLSQVQNVEELQDFLINYIKDYHKIKKNKEISEDLRAHRNIQIHNINVCNILSFGDTNITFSDINGIYGLCESNSFGKSSLCELLSICLFGMSPRCTSQGSFIRNEQLEGNVTVKLQSNNTEYEIKRTIKHHSKQKKGNPDIFIEIKKYDSKKNNKYKLYTNIQKYAKSDDKDIVYMKKECLSDKIKNEIISYAEIYEMMIVSQGRAESFLAKDNKCELLFKMSNLSYLDKIKTECSSLISSHKTGITNILKSDVYGIINNKKYGVNDRKEYKKHVIDLLTELDNNKQSTDNDILEIRNKFDDISKKHTCSKINLITYEERLRCNNELDIVGDVNMEDVNMEDVTININDIVERLDEYKNKKTKLQKKLKKNKKIIKSQHVLLTEYDDIENKYEKYESDKNIKIKNINDQVNLLNKQLKPTTTNVSKKKYIVSKKKIIDLRNNLDDLSNSIDKIKCSSNIINTTDNAADNTTSAKDIIGNYKIYLEKENEIIKCQNYIEVYNGAKQIIGTANKTIIKKFDSEIKIIQSKLDILRGNLHDMHNYKHNYDNYDAASTANDDNNLIKMYEEKETIVKKIADHDGNIVNYENTVHNNKIENEISDLDNEIYTLKMNGMDSYDKYIEIKNDTNLLEKNINRDELEYEKLINNINKYVIKKAEQERILKKIRDNQEKYDMYHKIKTEYEKTLIDHNKLDKEYIKVTNDLNSANNKNKQFNEKYIIAKNALDKCLIKATSLNNIQLISDSLINNGLNNKLMRDIVGNLQLSINEMCEYIGHEKINVDMIELSNNSHKKYDILVSTKTIPDVSNAGGFQSNIMELLFKIGFLKINSYFKCDLIIIDEIFDACSKENRPMAMKLVEFFKEKYKQMLLVSHNPDIISLFDSRIIIKKDDINGSTIFMR